MSSEALAKKISSSFFESSQDEMLLKIFQPYFRDTDLDGEKFLKECLFLTSFLYTVGIQIVFKSDGKLVNDEFHKKIIEHRFSMPDNLIEAALFENQMRLRYNNYFKLAKDEKGKFDFVFLCRQLPYDFFANVLAVDSPEMIAQTFRKKYARPIVEMGLFLANYLREVINFTDKIKENESTDLSVQGEKELLSHPKNMKQSWQEGMEKNFKTVESIYKERYDVMIDKFSFSITGGGKKVALIKEEIHQALTKAQNNPNKENWGKLKDALLENPPEEYA